MNRLRSYFQQFPLILLVVLLVAPQSPSLAQDVELDGREGRNLA